VETPILTTSLPTLPILILAAAMNAAASDVPRLPIVRTTSHGGIDVTMTVDRLGRKTADAVLQEGDDVVIRFEVKDAASKSPIRGARPGAWMDSKNRERRPVQCADRVKTFAGGSILERAEVDLNAFEVLAMNDDATISVVDPLFGYGGTKLMAMVALPAPADDWALSDDDNHLLVSIPAARQVAAVDTRNWKVARSVSVGAAPHRLALQPDQANVWTIVPGGVAVVRTRDLELLTTIATGSGANDLAFSVDSRWALVTNTVAGTVSVIDIRQLKKVKDLAAGTSPSSIDWSPLAGAAYVASADGTITVIGGDRMNVISTIKSKPGLVQMRVAPGGRYALAANGKTKSVLVIDTASNRIIQTADMPGQPEQIAFTPQLAYVRLRDAADVQMIGLAQLGHVNAPISLAEFPGGQSAFGEGTHPSSAAGMAQSASNDAMLIANPADQIIYYYEEGMAAPKGSFNNYSREARAVLVVDRSLHERAPGVYETVRRIDHAGVYDVAFLLDAPRIVDCYDVAVAADPNHPAPLHRDFAIQLAESKATPKAGEPVSLHFRLTDRGGVSIPAMNDGVVLIFAHGIWQTRLPAKPVGDGTYRVDFTPPQPGMYSAYLRSVSLGFDFTWFGTLQTQ
jgi:DNA-binding beta-propeller fold protein YncE